MNSGRWIKRGKLQFYINGERVYVCDNWQTFSIQQYNGRKQRIPKLIDNIMAGKYQCLADLHTILNEYDTKTFKYKRVFKMTSTRKEWIK